MKQLNDLTLPDPRNALFVKLGCDGQSEENITLEDYYQCAASVRLNPEVPGDICSYMQTLKNLFVYGWYHYPFCTLAGRLAPTVIEMALRRKRPKRGRDSRKLGSLLDQALARKFVKSEWDSGIGTANAWRYRRAQRLPGECPSRTLVTVRADIVKVTLREIRNSFVHPEMDQVSFPADALETMIVCGEIINQLWPADQSGRTAAGHGSPQIDQSIIGGYR